jgi:hypothetical protein
MSDLSNLLRGRRPGSSLNGQSGRSHQRREPEGRRVAEVVYDWVL